MDIQDLVTRSAAGEEEAFHELYEGLSNKLFRYLLARTSSRDDALDVLQDVFVDIWHALRRFRYETDAKFYGFVFTITKRKLARYYQSQKKHASYNEAIFNESDHGGEEETLIVSASVRAVVVQLKDIYRDVIELRYWSGLPFNEVAEMLGISESAAKVRHHRALKQLNRLIKK